MEQRDVMVVQTKEQRYQTLIDLGIALSSERNHQKLMQMILGGARSMTHADGGTLYLLDEKRQILRFEIILNETLGLAMGGMTGIPVHFAPLGLYDEYGQPDHRHIASHCALTGATVTVDDAYDTEIFDFSGTKSFDLQTGYHSRSFLTVPLKNHEREVVGVLQLINARDDDGRIHPFGADIVPLIEALASQAAVALDNAHLIEQQKKLFRAFIQVMANAIDAKSPYTGGHCNRVPVLTRMLAAAACASQDDSFAHFDLTAEEWYELEIAADLHDCGKVTTPEFVVDKATKLETIYNRIHEIRMRFEVLKRDATIAYLEGVLAGGDRDDLAARRDARLAELDADFAFVAECNVGTEFMAPDHIDRVTRIATQRWTRTLDDTLGLSHEELRMRQAPAAPLPAEEFLLDDKPWHVIPHDGPIDPSRYEAEGITLRPQVHKYNRGELYNLCIRRGTLTAEDRFIINDHIIQTILMLKALPFPKSLQRVPEWAGGHHEKMDGTGYPKGLTRDQMSIPARIMAIADIFEALTACDRPYKKAKPLSEAIRIMAFMARDSHIDPDLWELFLTSGIWREYAEQFLRPDQIDAVDIGAYLKRGG
jgi:HD-GYP domain-containing protein (c-di-GMP phosphodiesterase class II)